MNAQKQTRSKSLADVNPMPLKTSTKVEDNLPQGKSTGRGGLQGWAKLIKITALGSRKNPPPSPKLRQDHHHQDGVPLASQSPQKFHSELENYEIMLPCTKGIHVSKSGRCKEKQRMRQNITFDVNTVSTTFSPPIDSEISNGSISADFTKRNNIFEEKPMPMKGSLPTRGSIDNDESFGSKKIRKCHKISKTFSFDESSVELADAEVKDTKL